MAVAVDVAAGVEALTAHSWKGRISAIVQLRSKIACETSFGVRMTAGPDGTVPIVTAPPLEPCGSGVEEIMVFVVEGSSSDEVDDSEQRWMVQSVVRTKWAEGGTSN